MSKPAPRGPRKRRTPDAGLLTAWNRLEFAPDPPNLKYVTNNNREKLRVVAKLVFVLCDGQPGTRFFLGSIALGTLFGTHQRTAHRWIVQLKQQGIMRRVWTGRMVQKDEHGKPLAGGKKVDRASEFIYLGMPTTLEAKKTVYQYFFLRIGTGPVRRSKGRNGASSFAERQTPVTETTARETRRS